MAGVIGGLFDVRLGSSAVRQAFSQRFGVDGILVVALTMDEMDEPVILSDIPEPAHDAGGHADKIVFAQSDAFGGFGFEIFPEDIEFAFPDHENLFIRVIVERRAVLGRSHGDAAGKLPAGEGGAEILPGNTADVPVDRAVVPFHI